jgi:Zn-finger nucleic acid-binding protein
VCPACKEPLVVFELDGVEIDRCLRCGGTWLDAGEIDQLARLGGGAKDPLEAALSHAENPRTGDRRCVRCSTRMQVVTVQQVEIDRCPRGHGNWFDRDEIEALIAAHREGGVAKFLGELHPRPAKKGD